MTGCSHRNVTEDGVQLVPREQAASTGERTMYVLGTCRLCGQRVRQRWVMRHGKEWRAYGVEGEDVAPKRESA